LWAPELIGVSFNMPQFSNLSTVKRSLILFNSGFEQQKTNKCGKITMTFATYFTLHIIGIPPAIHLSMTINHSG